MYNVGGWYDIFGKGSVSNYMYLQEQGKRGAKGNQKLLMGPFGHGSLNGDLDYSDPGLMQRLNDGIRWFDYWLKGEDNGIMDEPAVTYYMMASARKGALSEKNGYRQSESWPPTAKTTRYYLQSDLGLSTTAPATDNQPHAYQFDPKNPVPTFGGSNLIGDKGPMDQRAVGERQDYLRFQTPLLDTDVAIAGPVTMELYAATDSPDTDFMVKLVDVYPDGYEAVILDNPIRARFRYGRNAEDEQLMSPGVPAKFEIDLWHTAQTFEKGHRIAVHVTSSNFPRFDVNPNTGVPSMEPRVATNSIYHDSQRPSAIVLPIVAATPGEDTDD
jgi:putative CocE/NonD family hydrolase